MSSEREIREKVAQMMAPASTISLEYPLLSVGDTWMLLAALDDARKTGVSMAAAAFSAPVPFVPKETIDHPSHYRPGKHEAIDVIEEWKLGFCLGNCVKYIARHELKGTALEDLKKSRWYLDRAIMKLEMTKQEQKP